MSVIWHDLECGSYVEDLPLWRRLAEQYRGPVLEIGAGTGRVALELAREGHRVTALDHDPTLIAELSARARGLEVRAVVADARSFELDERFALCLVPMQTIQLLGGSAGRLEFLRCARRHLRSGGLLAVAVSDALEPFDVSDGVSAPLPDMCERDGIVYASQPTAVRAQGGGFVLERRRETITASGERVAREDVVRLDGLQPRELEREALAAGFGRAGRELVAATAEYAGSVVVLLNA